MKILLLFLILFFLYELWGVICSGRERAAERAKKDKKYSFKKMNEEINERFEKD